MSHLTGEDAELPLEAVSMIRRDPAGRGGRGDRCGRRRGLPQRTHRGGRRRARWRSSRPAPDCCPPSAARSARAAGWTRPPRTTRRSSSAPRPPGGSTSHTPGVRVWIGGRWFSLVGVLDPVPLAPELDGAALVGWPAARTYLGFDGHPTTVYVRAADRRSQAVRAVLAATANPRETGRGAGVAALRRARRPRGHRVDVDRAAARSRRGRAARRRRRGRATRW